MVRTGVLWLHTYFTMCSSKSKHVRYDPCFTHLNVFAHIVARSEGVRRYFQGPRPFATHPPLAPPQPHPSFPHHLHCIPSSSQPFIPNPPSPASFLPQPFFLRIISSPFSPSFFAPLFPPLPSFLFPSHPPLSILSSFLSSPSFLPTFLSLPSPPFFISFLLSFPLKKSTSLI